MVSTRDILDAVNLVLVGIAPQATIYRDVIPQDFSRPSFFIRLEGRTVTSDTVQGVRVEQDVLIQCIDTVDQHYEADTDRLNAAAQAVETAFLYRGVLEVPTGTGGRPRRLTVDSVHTVRAVDVADLTLSLSYFDDRPETEREPAEIMQELFYRTQIKEANNGSTIH